MKAAHLSNFQKEQYTQYLETQLENFSSFMLNQRKENQKYRLWENIIINQNQKIKEMENKISLISLYQDQNYTQSQRVKDSSSRMFQNLESRLKRVEAIYCSTMLHKQKNEQSDIESIEKLNDLQNSIVREISTVSKNLQRKINNLQTRFGTLKGLQSNHAKYSPLPTANSEFRTIQQRDHLGFNQTNQNTDMATKKDLKKVEKKLREFFLTNFQKIEKVVSKSVKKRQKKSDNLNLDKQNNMNSVNVTQFEKSAHQKSKKSEREIQSQRNKEISYQPQSVFIFDRSATPSENTSFNDINTLKSKIESYFEAHKGKMKKRKTKRNRSKSISESKSNISKVSRSISHSKSVNKSQKSVSASKSGKNLNKNQAKAKKKQIRKSVSPVSKSKSKDKKCLSIIGCVNQYKKCCKKKHFL